MAFGIIALASVAGCKRSYSFTEGQQVRPSDRTNVSQALRDRGMGRGAFCLDTLSDAKQYSELDSKSDAEKREFLGRGKWQILGDVPMVVKDAKSDPMIVQISAQVAQDKNIECWIKSGDLELSIQK
jgi:hypothetical protein